MAKRKTDATMIARAKQPTEKQFLSQVVEYARLKGWLVYHTHDSRHSAAGFPDLVMTRHGVLVFAELKVGDNELSVNQREWMYRLSLVSIASPPVVVRVWCPEYWSEIETVLS